MTRPDLLEPFTTRAWVQGTQSTDPAGLIESLLEDIARRCDAEGASLIGHIKCYAQAGGDRLHCNLTSLRSGARCRRVPHPDGAAAAAAPDASQMPDTGLHVDLAVLVYGLARETIALIVAGALTDAMPEGATWSAAS